MVVLDFETYYAKDYSLSKMTTEAYINDERFEVIGVSVKEDEGEVRWITGTDEEILSALLEAGVDKKPVCCHNAAFDCAILSWHYGIRPPVIVDTLSMARPVIGLTESCSLRNLADHYGLGQKGNEIYNTLGKHRADFTPEELEAFGEYCRQDVRLTHALAKLLIAKTPAKELYLIDLTIRMFTEPQIRLDIPLLEKHLEEVRKHKQELMDSIGLDSRDQIMSNPKFAEMLRNLGVEPPMKVSPTTGKETYAFAKTDDGFKALLEHPDERVQTLASARLGLKSTIEETRTEAFLGIAKRMGAMPVMLNYYGAANTGRFSGGDRINPQNLPRGGVLRQAMRAPNGYRIVACDSSQVEARTLAWFAGEDELTQGFERNEDVYCAFASKVYGRTITKHDNPEERHVGKTCILGLGYGVGAKKLQYSLRNGIIKVDLPLERCQEIVNIYRNGYPHISQLWRDCGHALDMLARYKEANVGRGISLDCLSVVEPRVLLPNGMALRYPGLAWGTNEFGEQGYTYQVKKFRKKIYGGAMTENIVQALARIIVSYQMCAIKRNLWEQSAKMNDGRIRQVCNMVHDEVVVIVPEEEAEWCKNMMETCMKSRPSWAKTLPVSCEAGVGFTYGEAK